MTTVVESLLRSSQGDPPVFCENHIRVIVPAHVPCVALRLGREQTSTESERAGMPENAQEPARRNPGQAALEVWAAG